MIGIYKITNKFNNMSYVGQSEDVEKRLNSHKKHYENSIIDNEIARIGIENFTFEILEECELKELNRRESYYINKFDSIENGYNLHKGSEKDRMKTKDRKIDKYIEIDRYINKEDNTFSLKWNEYCMAAQELTPSALKLYMYLIKNKNEYNFNFTPKKFCETFNVNSKTCTNAKRELTEKGYIKEYDSNKLYFSSSAIFRETKENLKKELLQKANVLKIKSKELYSKFYNKLLETNLKEIQNDDLYKLEIGSLIDFMNNLVSVSITEEIEDLI